jgi:hypothetical protein
VKFSSIEKFGMVFGHRLNKSVCLLSVVTLMFLAATGCHRDDVKVYRIAKEQDQSSQPAAPALSTDSPNPKLPPGHPDISSIPGGGPASATGTPQLTWKTPAGWTEAPPTEMRVASFKVSGAGGKQADVSIVPLPGMAGTDSANVNRWRGQVGLSPMTDDELLKAAENVEAGGQPAQLYDIAGTNPGSGSADRILGVIQHRDGMAWFYKMTGDADLVEQQKPAFVEFLKSLNFGAAAPTQAEMPAGNPAAAGDTHAWTAEDMHLKTGNVGLTATTVSANTIPSVSHDGQPTWQVPAGWQEVPAGQFLVAKFTLTGDGGATAAVNVSSSPGDGGGLAANVNRWRGQLGLSPSPDISATPVDITGGKASLVDFSGTDARTSQPARLVGIVVSQSNQTWFYKLMGDAKVVESQKAAFTQFVQGVKY